MIERLKPKSEFSRNVLTMITGTTIAQAIPVAISPILTRIYTPEDFGVFAIFIAIAAIFGAVASGRYELAIMLPKKDEDAINIFALGFIITTLISFFLLILILLFGDQFVLFINDETLKPWLYFVPISVFLLGLWNILNYFNNRKKQYKELARANILKSLILAIVQLSFGFMKAGVGGLISGQIFSQLFANIKLLISIIKNKTLISKISKIKILALAKKYKKFPKFSIPSTFMNTASLQVPVLLLGVFFNSTIVGFYSLSHRFINMPMTIIGSSIGQVFFQESSNIKNDEKNLRKLTLSTYKKLFKIGLIPFLLVIVFADYIFGFVFGKNWIIAGEYAQVLSLWIFFVYISAPLSNLCFTLEKQKQALYFNTFILFSRIFVILYGAIFLKDAYLTILIFGITGFIFWLSWSMYLLKLVGIKIFSVLLYTFVYIFTGIVSLTLIRGYFC